MTTPEPAAAADDARPGPVAATGTHPAKRPVYPRLLRLRHLRLSGWQRAVLGEGAVAAALLLVAADVATGWTLLVLPLAVAAVVKVNDVVAGVLRGPAGPVTPADQHDGPPPG